MAKITLHGESIETAGDLPAVGTQAPELRLAGADFSDVDLSAFSGKVKVLNIVPSLDTPVCVASARRFNEAVGDIPDAVVLQISADLPFAQQRVCTGEGLSHVVGLSTFRSPSFGDAYGVGVVKGPISGLMSRAVLVLDREDRVVYAEQVPEISQEPDYEPAIAAARKAVG